MTLLGALDERELKIWRDIQRLKAASDRDPRLDVKEQLAELRRALYERTGGRGD